MTNFFISAIYTSPPTTMGGNTKIMLEFLKSLQKNSGINIVIFTTEPLTFRNYFKENQTFKILDVDLPYKKHSILTHVLEVVYMYKFYLKYFKKYPNIDLSKTYFYSCSDWWSDTLPIGFLKIKYPKFMWVSSLFLFIPNIFENIKNKYGFPMLKYLIYYYYQKISLFFIYRYSYKTVITNHLDKRFFSKKYENFLYPIYGGVNIDILNKVSSFDKIYDGVFCGRLHPQKGPDILIKIWKMVVDKNPSAKLIIIGNGEIEYTNYLKELVKTLELNNNIEFLGYINDFDKFVLLKKSKIFLHTSVYDNNGMVAAEALCAGIPVVMFDHEYLKEIYTDFCIKVPVGDNLKYAESINNLLSPNSKNYKNNLPYGKKLENIKDFWNFTLRTKNLVKFILFNNKERVLSS